MSAFMMRAIATKYDLVWSFDYYTDTITVYNGSPIGIPTDAEKQIVNDYLYHSFGCTNAIVWRLEPISLTNK